MIRRLPPVLLAAALVLGGCGGGDDEESEPAGASLQTVEIAETEFKLDPGTVSLDEPGTYTFRAVNSGQTDHALEIEGEGVEEETDTIGPGESAEVEVELQAGEYELYCPVGNHKDRGMEGMLSVSGG